MLYSFRSGVFLCLALLVGASAQPAAPTHTVREQAWDILDGGLRHNKASHRLIAVQTLGLMAGNHRAARMAIEALRDHDQHVRTLAAVSLGQINLASAIPDLREALQDSEISVVLASAHSLLLLKDKHAYDVYYAILMRDRKSSEGLVQAQLDRLKDPKQMMQLGFEEGIGFVPFGGVGYEALRQLRSRDGDLTRAAAARALANDPDQISEDALVQTALADKSEPVRLAALDALAQKGDARVIDRLTMNLNDDRTAVRYRTAAVILHLGDIAPKTRREKKSTP